MAIYWTVDALLKARGWTRYRLAKELGIEPSTIYKILKRKEPTLDALCRVLDCQPGELLEYKKR